MPGVLLSVHVLAAIVLIGPMTVAASLFPRYARAAARAMPGEDGHDQTVGPVAVATAMHRITRGYAVPALVVPVFGIATAARMGVLGQAWLAVSRFLTAGAALLLVARVVPGQRRVLEVLDGRRLAGTASAGGEGGATTGAVPAVSAALLSRLGMTTGLFALAWAVVVVLMILRPGSSTGAGL